jgi:hypothetical protein
LPFRRLLPAALRNADDFDAPLLANVDVINQAVSNPTFRLTQRIEYDSPVG